MHHRTTTAAAAGILAATLSLTACSSSTPKSTAPAPTPTLTATAAAAPSSPTIDGCAKAIHDEQDSSNTHPEACAGLSLDDYMEALHRANEQGINDLQREIDEASASAAAAGGQ